LKEKVGAEEDVEVEVEVEVAAVEVSGLRKLKALLSTFFASAVGVVAGVAFVSDSVGFVKEKNDLEAAALATGGVLGAPNEKPPIALGGSAFVGVDAGELAPKENPEVDALTAGDAGAAETAPKENPVVEAVGTDGVAGAAAAAVMPDDVLPNAKDVEDGAADATDGEFVAEGVLVAAIPPNTFPLANVGLLRGEFWFNPLTSDTARRNGDWRALLEAAPNGDDAGWLPPNANCEVGTEDVGVVIEEGLSKGDATAGGLLAPNENELFCAA
jgi:nucleoid-associated protein YgaU